jgi:hypothetical protein
MEDIIAAIYHVSLFLIYAYYPHYFLQSIQLEQKIS